VALRVGRRRDCVVQAAVGLSLTRRRTALEFSNGKQQDKVADPYTRMCACWLAIGLGSDDLPGLRQAFESQLDIGPRIGRLFRRLAKFFAAESSAGFFRCSCKHPRKATRIASFFILSGRQEDDLGMAALVSRLDTASVPYAFDKLVSIFVKQVDGKFSMLSGLG